MIVDMLEIRGVKKTYLTGGIKRVVLNDISVNFRTSEFVTILGPSGSGKTTLLNIVGGLDKYSAGDLIVNEKSTKKFRDKDWDSYRNHRIGFVFQNYNLIPHQTVLQNVRLALTLSGISKRDSIRRAKKALKDVGLEDHIDKRPNQLSGGQMQRVAIARALVNDPDILLADEPTGALDSETSVQVMDILKKIAKDKLVIMVTHNPDLAKAYATRIIKLKDGKITSDSNPYNGKKKTDLELVEAQKKSKKTKMSFLTALSLSLKNLMTKKARTILVSIAGSIGIIGIALISAVSTGFQNYIDKIEHDTLTSYPLSLMQESTNITGILLSMTGMSEESIHEDGKLHESQILSSTLGNVTKNDLASFRDYLNRHYSEVEEDIRLIEYEYNIDPMIYTIDATGELAQLNPNNLFSTILGDNSLMNSYSNLTSSFRQYDLENIKTDTNLVAGRYPEEYNEMVVYLSNEYEISDFLTYSLGLHDTDRLSEIIKKIMGGEDVEINEEPLVLTYDDLMSVDLRLVYAADTYKYNEKYDVYEDMSGDLNYMMNIYENDSEELKIVGIVTPNSELTSGNGILYLPSLVRHIIEKSSEKEIVKKQLASPTIDIFSGTKFGEESNDFNFEFSDLVSVDNAALSQAFNVTIDQNAISAKTTEYINQISDDITADISPVKDVLTDRFRELSDGLMYKILEIIMSGGTIDQDNIDSTIEEYLNELDFTVLTEKYLIPVDSFKSFYAGLLKGYLGIKMQDPTMEIDSYLSMTEVGKAFDTLSIAITEVMMKQAILTKVGGLTTYLTSSFSKAFNIDESKLLSAFKLNFTEEELSRIVTAMFTKKESTLSTNLALLGYQDLEDPFEMAFYFNSFDGKTHFIKFLDDYNELMKSYDSENKVIDYTDTTGVLMSSVKTIVDAVSYVLIAFVSISLIVSSIMIGVITYISVYERTKEIGILRAIGASKHNISSIFNAETFIIGFLSGLFGVVISYLLVPIINIVLHHFTGDIPLSAMLDPRMAGFLIVLSIVLTLIGGLIPARSASKKDPVEALRSE